MHKLNKLAFTNVWQFFCDIIFLLLAFIAAYFFSARIIYLDKMYDYIWVLFIYVPFWVFYMASMGMYNRTTFNYFDRVFRYVVFSTLIAGISVAVMFYFSKNYFFSRTLFSYLIVFTILLLLFERYTFLHFSNKFRKTSDKRVLVIGTQELIEKFEYYLKKTQISMNITGYMQLDKEHPLNYVSIGCLDDLPSMLKDNIVDEIIMALPKEYVVKVEEHIMLCEEMGITARILLDLYGLKIAKTNLNFVGTIPMLTYHTVSLNDVQLFAKRLLDIVGASVGLIITGLVSIFVIPAILLDSPGPIFFNQDRVGLNGRIFKLYKFRSMMIDAEEKKAELMDQNQVKGGLMFKIKVDPRITKIGKLLRKTSMDELPQFWNVLRGDMSLVGTRPPTPDEVSKYLNGHWRRISIKPGLTGLWQVSGRSSIMDFDEVVRLDTNYIDRWSITEDLKIIFMTIPAVFAKKGAM